MTQPIVETVVPEVKEGPPAIVEEVNKKTPDPVTPPVVNKLPDPPTPHEDGLVELRDVVGKLATSVASLTALVTESHKDESPNSVPWTHRGHPVHGDDENTA